MRHPVSPAAASYDPRVVEGVIAQRRHLDGALMPILHGVQDTLGWVPADVVPQIAQALNLSRAEVHGVISYYHHFRPTPARGPLLQVCRAESCRTMGGQALLEQAQAAGGCSVKPVYCLGLCAMSPAVMLQGEPHARMTPDRLAELLANAAQVP